MSLKLSSLSILIPCYNDEFSIETEVEEAYLTARKVTNKFEIIVINDASVDKTGEILKRLSKKIKELKVVTHTANAGYGQTIKELYLTAANEWIFTTPGDYQIPPKEIFKLLSFQDAADMIIGWRNNRHDPKERLRQSLVYNLLLKALFGLKIHDVNSVRLMKTRILKKIRLSTTSAFVDAELAIDAIRNGFILIEEPIGHRARDKEVGAGGGKFQTIIPVIKDMLMYRIFPS